MTGRDLLNCHHVTLLLRPWRGGPRERRFFLTLYRVAAPDIVDVRHEDLRHEDIRRKERRIFMKGQEKESGFMAAVLGFGLTVSGCGEGGEGPIVPPPPAPAEYADKHMPAGWWADQKIIDEGREFTSAPRILM